MSDRHLIYFSIPGLRPSDVTDATVTPTLSRWASSGVLAQIEPSFPCVTSSVQASTWTGRSPGQHGVIANGFYHRDRREVEFWVGRNGVIQGEQIWDTIARTGGLTSAVWHAQNIKDAAADYIVTPEPIHHADGRMDLWCYSKPEGLYQQLFETLGHFPLQHYWGPGSNLESSRWILRAARWLNERHRPNFHYIYLPHLDYASQKHGPDSDEARESVRLLDGLLGEFAEHTAAKSNLGDVVFLAVSEYALTEVTGVIYPNVELRRRGLLQTRTTPDGEVIDYEASEAFAMVDHQCAHVYAKPEAIDAVVNTFESWPGVSKALAGDRRDEVGLVHDRSGEVILVADRDRWFAYYWWIEDDHAPAFARTVDIHRKPGYDPVELFMNPDRSIPLNAKLVRGSHGAPVGHASQRGAVICSQARPCLPHQAVIRDTDVRSVVLRLLDIETE